MALKDVKNYFKEEEKLYFDMLNSLSEMQKEFEEGNITEEELNKMLLPVTNIKNVYLLLAYVIYLFNQPNRKKKISKYKKQNREINSFFEDNDLSMDIALEKDKDALKLFKENLKKLKRDE